VDIRDGVQYVTVRAKGGYSPKISSVQSGIPTKLIVKTDNTYDCSASLVIPSIKFKKILQPTGQEVIDLGVLQSGKTIQVLCSMGMYSFQIKAI
jgi:plastocyanin domain-containing protein